MRARTVLRSTLVNLPQGACSHDPCRRLTPHCCAPPGSLPLDTSGTISRTLTVNLLCNGEDLPAPEAGVAGGADVVMNWPTAAACTPSPPPQSGGNDAPDDGMGSLTLTAIMNVA